MFSLISADITATGEDAERDNLARLIELDENEGEDCFGCRLF